MENVISVKKCRRCAECCKNFPFVQLSRAEVDSIAQVTGLPVEVFTNSKGRAVEEYFLNFKEGGSCFFLNENNGYYSCAVYEVRSAICVDYPSSAKQVAACDLNRNNPTKGSG